METITCEYCGKSLPKDEAVYVESADIYLCPECADDQLVTCERCGERILRDDAYQGFDGHLCENCHDDLFG